MYVLGGGGGGGGGWKAAYCFWCDFCRRRHSVSWINRWSLTTYTDTSLGGGKVLIRFWWPWPHWKMACLHPVSWRNEWIEFYQTCTAILLGHGQELVRFWWLRPYFQSHTSSKNVGKCLFLHPISWRNGWILAKLAQIYWWDVDKNWLDFGDLDPFSRSHKVLECWRS